ncbi:MAG: ATP-binding protein [Pirellulales bacterium]
MKGVDLPLYRLPELLAATEGSTVYIVEGEKDVETLRRHGLVATCNAGGAGKWRDHHTAQFSAKVNLVVISDNDQAGHAHAQHVAASLRARVLSIKVVADLPVPPKGDVSDYLTAPGNTIQTLQHVVAATPQWAPSETAPPADEPRAPIAPSARPHQTNVVIDLAMQDSELWHCDGIAHATVAWRGVQENLAIASRAFRRALQARCYALLGCAPSAQVLQDALGVLEGRAIFESPQFQTHLRVAGHGNRCYIDLADERRQAVEVDAAGWRLMARAPVKFRRPRALAALPVPEAGELSALRQFVNVDAESWPLLLTWLVAALYPRGPYPVLVLAGEQGTGKTTLARVLRALFDPNLAPVRTEPRDQRDLMIAANNQHGITFDNLSKIPDWFSDAICRLATGGALSSRALWTDEEEAIFQATRPVNLTSIEDVATRGDLLDRSIVITMTGIPGHQRRPESDFWSEFESRRPAIFGGLLDALSMAIARLPSTQPPTLPRMADFARLAIAVEPALGLAPGSFLASYEANGRTADTLAIDASPVARLVLELCQERREWEGTAEELLLALRQLGDGQLNRRDWPQDATRLSGALRRAAPGLRKAGLEIEMRRETSGKRRRLIRVAESIAQNSVPERSSGPAGLDSTADGALRTAGAVDPYRSQVELHQGGPLRTADLQTALGDVA